MKRTMQLAGIEFTFEKSVKEMGPKVVAQVKTLQAALDKIKPTLEDLKKKQKGYTAQVESLRIYIKDMFPELYKEVEQHTEKK